MTLISTAAIRHRAIAPQHFGYFTPHLRDAKINIPHPTAAAQLKHPSLAPKHGPVARCTQLKPDSTCRCAMTGGKFIGNIGLLLALFVPLP